MSEPLLFNSKSIISTLELSKDDSKIERSEYYFKTGEGQYGEHDKFWGIRNPDVRAVVKRIDPQISVDELVALMSHEVHEVRLCGAIAMAEVYRRCYRGNKTINTLRENIIRQTYLNNIERANNWDLVDLSAPDLIGRWLVYGEQTDVDKEKTLDALSQSDSLWAQRAAIVSCLTPVRNGRIDWALKYAKMLLTHKHDLIHKAIGWLLREVGKKNIDALRLFLSDNGHLMARTTLRYAIEKLEDDERMQWLKRQF